MDPPPTVVAHRAGLARAAGAGEKRPAKMTAANQRGGNGNGAKRWTNNDGSSASRIGSVDAVKGVRAAGP